MAQIITESHVEKATILYNFARDLGYNHDSAIGVCANVMAESEFNHQLTEVGGGGGYGLGQWTPKSNLYSQGSTLGYTQTQCETFDVQCDILLRGDETGQWLNDAYTGYDSLVITPLTLNEYKKQTGLSRTTMNYMAHWERPSYDPNINHKGWRKEHAGEFDERINGSGGSGSKPCFPTSEGSVVTSPYGWREHPITHEQTFHQGTDFAHPDGTSQPVYATMNGEVVHAGTLAGSGGAITIIIDHDGDDYFSAYLHLSSLDVELGQKVDKCEKIGMTGETGNVTGIHLHFEIAKTLGGLFTDEGTYDPEIYLETATDGGDDGGGGDTKLERRKTLIKLLLSDCLNGWKY